MPTLYIQPDTDPQSPREWDNVGHIVSWCDQAPGDEYPQLKDIEAWKQEFVMLAANTEHELSIEDVDAYLEKHFIFVPVYAYIHSGIVLSTSPFSCPWDSGQIGYIYVAKEDYEKHGIRDDEHATEILEGEIRTYSQYVAGEIIEFVVESKDGEILESLGSIHPYDSQEETEQYILSIVSTEFDYIEWRAQ